MKCMFALMKDAVLRQRDDKHGRTDERCCTEDSGMSCMIAIFERCWTEDSEMIYLVALWKYAVLRQRDDVHGGTLERCCTEFSEMIW